MKVNTAILSRASVRAFDPSHAISAEQKRELLELAGRAPSAWNIQHWRFVLIENDELRQQMRDAAMGQPQVTDCSMFVAIVVDLEAWNRSPARYFDFLPDDYAQAYAAKIQEFYNGREWLARDDAMRSCGLAAQTLMLATTAAGLASCPMDLFDEERVSQLLRLPAGHVVAMFVAIGKALPGSNAPKASRLPYDEVVLIDRFGASA